MENPVSNQDEHLAGLVTDYATRLLLAEFAQRPLETVAIDAALETPQFWRAIGELIEQVGEQPVLVVSPQTRGRLLRRFVYGRNDAPPGLNIRTDRRAVTGGTYVATINDVDIFAGHLPIGHAQLFSARALREIEFSQTANGAPLVVVDYEPSSETSGAIKATFRVEASWSPAPRFNLQLDDPDDDAA
jgi:hypothetical protein